MNNITTLFVAAIGVGLLAFTNAITADAPPSKPVELSYAEDVEQLRAEFHAQCIRYEQMIKPYDQRLENFSEGRLTEPEAKVLLAEVDVVTGRQEKLVQALKKKLAARIQQAAVLQLAY